MVDENLWGYQLYEAKWIPASENTSGLSVQLDTRDRALLEVIVESGGAATFHVYGSKDGSEWLEEDTITHSVAKRTFKGYYNPMRYVKVESTDTGIDLGIWLIAKGWK